MPTTARMQEVGQCRCNCRGAKICPAANILASHTPYLQKVSRFLSITHYLISKMLQLKPKNQNILG
ncbi:hypothetical protein EQU24_20195 [Methylotuvimicrobium buryatense]|uniref:Uncharacterized protein n=1 Tax=Methylotuvimicrobium buryatense TaxID=95641 RepID=A0A4P9US01_METBY|nr:hypothetical protein EQU24_20195 [Methylotuvimicrobium buryatense]